MMQGTKWKGLAAQLDDHDRVTKLKQFLSKLGIRSAQEDIMNAAFSNFGRPDVLYMSPDNLKAFQKAFSKKP
jgi:hypothetical protein